MEKRKNTMQGGKSSPLNSIILQFLKTIMLFGITLVDDAIQTFGKMAMGMKKKGTVEGVRGIPDSKIRTAAPSEKELLQGLTHAQNEVKQGFSDKKVKLELEKAAIEVNETLVLSEEQREKQLENNKSKAGYEANRSLKKHFWSGWFGSKSTIDFDTQINDLNERIRDLNERLTLMNETHEFLKFRGLPIKKFWDYASIYWFSMFVFFVLEVGFNFSTISETKIDKLPFVNLSIGLVLAFLQGIFAIALGMSMAKKNYPYIAMHAIFFLMSCYAMGAIRWNTGLSLDLRFISAGISIFFGLGMIFFSHKRHINFEYFENIRRRRKTSAKIVKLKSEIKSLEKECNHRVDQAIEKTEQNWNESLLTNRKDKTIRLQQIESELAQLASKEDQALGCLKQIYFMALEEYRKANQSARKSSSFLPVLLWQEGIEDDTSSSQAEDGGSDPIDQTKPALGDTDTIAISPTTRIASLLLVTMVLGLSACSDNTQIEPIANVNHVEIVYDVTGDNQNINAEGMVGYILEEVGINERDSEWEETHITLSQITQLSAPEIHQVRLEASKGSYWFRDGEAHQKILYDFRNKLSEKIALISQASEQQNESLIFRNVQSRLKEIAQHKGKKLVLIWSDFLQNSKKTNFYHYLPNPEKLLEEKEKVIKAVEEGYKLPNLEGVKIVNHHSVDKKYDELYEAIKKLLISYWEVDHNADVEFKNGPDLYVI